MISRPACGTNSHRICFITRATSKNRTILLRSVVCSVRSRNPTATRGSIIWRRHREFYETAVLQLGRSGLADESGGARRVIIEKPFGTNLESARRLNELIHSVFPERQVYRIDHYLGKERSRISWCCDSRTRFSSRSGIATISITYKLPWLKRSTWVAAAYYDSAGVIRDMFQNHLLQLMTVVAMEAPVRYEADAIRGEKVKVLEAVRHCAAKGSTATRSAARFMDMASCRACGRIAVRRRSPS